MQTVEFFVLVKNVFEDYKLPPLVLIRKRGNRAHYTSTCRIHCFLVEYRLKFKLMASQGTVPVATAVVSDNELDTQK